jgi:hypothetical protein
MNTDFKNFLLDITNSSDCTEVEVIQSLWSGYGKISRVELIEADRQTVVVKCISLSQVTHHPRGWNTDLSHQRKVKSYRVETSWYEQWSRECSSLSKIPQFLGSFSQNQDQWIVMEDLNAEFPLRKSKVTFSEVKTCLRWLANFHGSFLGKLPDGLWEIGTYWHLDTRPDEWALIEDVDLKSKAHLIDKKLNDCQHQTIVHGDAKLANFCFSADGQKVAAVDFQYVGGGCGMKDVAYFLGSCLSGEENEMYEGELLNFYFAEMRMAITDSPIAKKEDFEAIEEEWRALYPCACADFTRFLLGWMPTHQKVNDYNLKMLQQVLAEVGN